MILLAAYAPKQFLSYPKLGQVTATATDMGVVQVRSRRLPSPTLDDSPPDRRADIVKDRDNNRNGQHHYTRLAVAQLLDVLTEHKANAPTSDEPDNR